MNLQYVKGTSDYINACAKTMEHSTLSATYFPTEESRIKAVTEGINSGNLYVVLCDGACGGFAYYLPEGAFHAYHYLHLIAISEEYRGKGIGTLLLEYMENLLFQTKDKIFLLVGDYNPGARAFYEKAGYQYIGTIPSLYRKGIDENLMMKVHI